MQAKRRLHDLLDSASDRGPGGLGLGAASLPPSAEGQFAGGAVAAPPACRAGAGAEVQLAAAWVGALAASHPALNNLPSCTADLAAALYWRCVRGVAGRGDLPALPDLSVLAACLWCAVKFWGNRTAVPEAPYMAAITGAQELRCPSFSLTPAQGRVATKVLVSLETRVLQLVDWHICAVARECGVLPPVDAEGGNAAARPAGCPRGAARLQHAAAQRAKRCCLPGRAEGAGAAGPAPAARAGICLAVHCRRHVLAPQLEALARQQPGDAAMKANCADEDVDAWLAQHFAPRAA
eukprot:scaffold3.g6623.t1